MSDKMVKWLETLLRERKWSIRELSRQTEIDPSNLSKILSGKKNFTLDTYIKLAEGLDEPLEVILRLADILPERDGDPTLSDWVAAGKRLTPDERKQILDYADYVTKKRKSS